MATGIDSKTKRSRLEPRREPYWFRLRAGAQLGYRKLDEGEGTWIAKWRDETTGKRHYKALGTIIDDDSRSAFDKARREAEAWLAQMDHGAMPKGETVEDACKLYVADRRKEKGAKNADDAEGRFRRLVYGRAIGARPLDKLGPADIRKWLLEQIPDEDDVDDPDETRRAKDSANRNLAALKAALNLAYRHRLVAHDAAWRTVRPFEKVGRRRERLLNAQERRRLIEKAPPALANLCRAILLTAARPGELSAADVADLDRKQGTLTLQGKTNRRTVSLSTAAAKFLVEITRNRLPTAPLLPRGDGARYDRFTWRDEFRQAAEDAGLPEDVVLYSLRHAAISEMLIGGVNPSTVAKLAGTSTAMIDRHYGHLIHDHTRAKLDAVNMF